MRVSFPTLGQAKAVNAMDAFTKLWPFAAKQKSDRGRRGFGAPRNGKRERNLCLSEWPSPSFAPAPAAARSSAAARCSSPTFRQRHRCKIGRASGRERVGKYVSNLGGG